MKSKLNRFTMVLGIVLLGTLLHGKAYAGCLETNFHRGAALVPQSWNGQLSTFRLISDNGFDNPIVGMWKVTFTAEGNPDGPPNDTVIDSAIVVWHSDGTEIMNSGRPPQDGNFCMGVWQRVGAFRYKLNHFALGNDAENAPSGIGNSAGPTRITEEVVVSPDRNHYSGTFTLDAYDTSNNRVAHIIGAISAKRITINTPESGVL